MLFPQKVITHWLVELITGLGKKWHETLPCNAEVTCIQLSLQLWSSKIICKCLKMFFLDQHHCSFKCIFKFVFNNCTLAQSNFNTTWLDIKFNHAKVVKEQLNQPPDSSPVVQYLKISYSTYPKLLPRRRHQYFTATFGKAFALIFQISDGQTGAKSISAEVCQPHHFN